MEPSFQKEKWIAVLKEFLAIRKSGVQSLLCITSSFIRSLIVKLQVEIDFPTEVGILFGGLPHNIILAHIIWWILHELLQILLQKPLQKPQKYSSTSLKGLEFLENYGWLKLCTMCIAFFRYFQSNNHANSLQLEKETLLRTNCYYYILNVAALLTVDTL